MEGNREVIQTQKKISFKAITLSAVAVVFLLFANEAPMAKGLLLGTCFSILNFILMGLVSPATLGRTRRKAGIIAFCSIISRYALLSLPLILSIKSPSFAFLGVAIGLFAVQIVILFEHVARPLWGEK